MRIVTQRGRAGSFTGHIIPGKELRVLEAEKNEKTTGSRLRYGNLIPNPLPSVYLTHLSSWVIAVGYIFLAL